MKRHLQMARSGIPVQLYPFFGHRFSEARLRRKARIQGRDLEVEKSLCLQSNVIKGKIGVAQSTVAPTAAKGGFINCRHF